MPRVRLVIDRPTTDLWSDSTRRSMLNLTANLSDLEWSYRVADGGCWAGKAEFTLPEDGFAWKRLVEQGASGLAWIYHDRSEDDASEIDEDTDLLWFGIAEDAIASRGGNAVELKLRGAGQFLKQYTYTATHKAESIHTIADAAIQAVIDEGESPITAMDTDNAGVLQKKVSVEFENDPLDRVLKTLADLAGGPAMVAWGVRPSSASSSFGTAYLKLNTGHLYEKDNSASRDIFTVDQAQIYDYELEARNSDIRNHIVVIGDQIENDHRDDNKDFYTAEVESGDSIEQFGRRKKVVRDSSLKTDGQCALLAAGTCKNLAARRIAAKARFTLAMNGNLTEGGATDKAKSLLYHLKNAGRLVVIRDKDKAFSAFGDSRNVLSITRNASTARYATIDTSNGPTDSDEVIQDPASLAASDKRLYEFTRIQTGTTSTSSPATLYIAEIEDRLGVAWYASGANWKMLLAKRDNTGTWGVIGTSSVTVTTAKIQAEHTVALEVRYNAVGSITVAGYFSDGTTTTQMISSTVTLATLYGMGTPRTLYVNATASSAGPAPAGDCAAADYSQVLVWKDWDETGGNTTATFLDAHANESAPFQRWGDLVLMTNASDRDSSSPANAWVRYAFGNSTLDGEYAWTPSYDGGEVAWEDSTDFSHRKHTWRLGTGSSALPFGTHLEIVAMRAKVKHTGADSPLQITLTGEAGTRLTPDVFEDIIDRVTIAEGNQRKGADR